LTNEPVSPGPSWQRGRKSTNIVPTMKRFVRYLKKYRLYIFTIVALGTIISILSIIAPRVLGDLTDQVADCIENGTALDMDSVFVSAAILITLYLVIMIFEIMYTRMEWMTEEKVGGDLRLELSRKVSRIPVGLLDKMQTGDVMSRFVNDNNSIRNQGVECITRTIEMVIMLAGCIIVMFLTDWKLALASLVPTILGFLIIRVIVKLSQKYYRAQSRNLGKMNNIVEETYRGLNVVTVYNGLDETKKRFDEVNQDLFSTTFKSRFFGSLMPEIIGFVNNLGYAFVCIVGSVLIIEGESTFGTLVAFIVYVKISNRPLMALSNTLAGLQEVAAAAERTFEFLDTPEMDNEDDAVEVPDRIKGEIEFKDVRFSYVPGTEVIHDLNLHVDVGQRIAIVGPTGAGKTTISNLLLRYYDPDSGSITVDGIDTTKIRRDDVRDMFGVVLQETWLFKGTIRENLIFDSPGVPDSRVEEVCRAVGLGTYLDRLPKGLDTYLENPQTLSAGQRQQITIARAIIKDAPLLIMDEATSSVDTRTERTIQQAMDHLMTGRTSFVIAHRLSTIKSADRIIVIRKGEIVESGTHDELIAQGGFYRSLYDSQFEFCE